MRQSLGAKSADLPSNGTTDQDDTKLAKGLAAQSGLRRSAMRGGAYLIGPQVVEGMELQLLAVGTILLGFAWMGHTSCHGYSVSAGRR